MLNIFDNTFIFKRLLNTHTDTDILSTQLIRLSGLSYFIFASQEKQFAVLVSRETTYLLVSENTNDGTPNVFHKAVYPIIKKNKCIHIK